LPASAPAGDPLYSVNQRVRFRSGNAVQTGTIIKVDAGSTYGFPYNSYVIRPDAQPNVEISLYETRVVGPEDGGRRRKTRKHKKSKKSKKTRKH